MAISDSQKVDYLWKKLGYSAAKTDTNANKKAPNEAIASPLLLRSDTIWAQAHNIPAILPGSTSQPVTVYPTSAPQECTQDLTATANRTWKTGGANWISPEFGSTYQVKVYIHTAGDAAGASGGTQVFATGSGNDDEWFFDYQSGVLHFIGTNLPNGVSFTGKSVYVSGGRYTGDLGIGSIVDANISSGNVTANISGNVVGGGYGVFEGNVSADWFLGNLDSNIGTFDTSLYAAEATIGSNTAFTNSSATIQYLTIEGETITSTNANLVINPNTSNANNVVKIGGVTALDIPTGNTAQRPANPDQGYIRFNSQLGTLEWYTGAAWATGSSGVTQQSITPDGTSDTYTLDQESTEDSILVNINGTAQHPGVAYTVSGFDITFAEVPLTTDIIDIRFMAVAVASSGLNSVIQDTSPQLGGNLDVNSKFITSASDGNVQIKPDGIGNVIVEAETRVTGDLIVEGAIKSDTFYFVKRSTNTSITYPGSYGAVTIDYEDAGDDYGSTDAMWDSSTDRFTPTVAGLWYIRASVDAYSGATQEGGIYIEKNGTQVAQNSHIGFIRGQIVTHLYMNGTTDYIQFKSYTQSATTRGQSAVNSFFEALLVKQAE